MSTVKHTPGPWGIERIYGKETNGLRIVGNDSIAIVLGCTDNRLANADAKLIAAAPELLAALKFSLSVHKAQGMYDLSEKMAVKTIEAAIQKAEGDPK